jgi:hypothetical protein
VAFVSEKVGLGAALGEFPHQSTAHPIPKRFVHFWSLHVQVPPIATVTVPSALSVSVPVVAPTGFAASANAVTGASNCNATAPITTAGAASQRPTPCHICITSPS